MDDGEGHASTYLASLADDTTLGLAGADPDVGTPLELHLLVLDVLDDGALGEEVEGKVLDDPLEHVEQEG